jgi:hypothetical protein
MDAKLPIWKEKSMIEKSLTIIGGAVCATIIVLAVLQITGVYEKAIMIFEPLLGVLMLIQALQFRKRNKIIAFISACAAVFIFIVGFVIFFLR